MREAPVVVQTRRVVAEPGPAMAARQLRHSRFVMNRCVSADLQRDIAHEVMSSSGTPRHFSSVHADSRSSSLAEHRSSPVSPRPLVTAYATFSRGSPSRATIASRSPSVQTSWRHMTSNGVEASASTTCGAGSDEYRTRPGPSPALKVTTARSEGAPSHVDAGGPNGGRGTMIVFTQERQQNAQNNAI